MSRSMHSTEYWFANGVRLERQLVLAVDVRNRARVRKTAPATRPGTPTRIIRDHERLKAAVWMSKVRHRHRSRFEKLICDFSSVTSTSAQQKEPRSVAPDRFRPGAPPGWFTASIQELASHARVASPK
jgi:hypothetical protein